MNVQAQKAVEEAVIRIRALRKLARTTPVMTHKSQYQILQSLAPEVLAEVAVILDKDTDNDQFNR